MTKKKIDILMYDGSAYDVLDGKMVDVIQNLQGMLDSVEDEYKENVWVDVYQDYDGCTELCIKYSREETDEEYEVRTKVEARQAEMSMEYKLQQYLNLKDELGDLV